MLLAPKIPNKPNQNRVDFRVVEFRRLIETKGLNMVWSQSSECPCRFNTTTDFNFNLVGVDDLPLGIGANTACPVCEGSGVFTHSPQPVKGIFTRSQENPPTENGGPDSIGEYRREQAKITLLPEHLPHNGDVFVLTDSFMVYRETAVMKTGDVQSLRYPVAVRTLNLADGVTQVGVLYLMTSDTNNEASGELVAGEDFEIDEDGNLDFSICLPAKRPPVGSYFSVSYYIHPRYTVIQSVHTIRDTFTRLKSLTNIHEALPVQVDVQLDTYALDDPNTAGRI
jgi:hypothetical protein